MCANLVVLCKLCEKSRCFLGKFIQLEKNLHDRRSWRLRQISTLSKWWIAVKCQRLFEVQLLCYRTYGLHRAATHLARNSIQRNASLATAGAALEEVGGLNESMRCVDCSWGEKWSFMRSKTGKLRVRPSQAIPWAEQGQGGAGPPQFWTYFWTQSNLGLFGIISFRLPL